MPNDLNGDETIRDILGSLNDKKEYVRGVFGNMPTRRQHDCLVRIGVTGEGKVPNYRIELLGSLEAPERPAELVAYSGLTHKVLDLSAEKLRESKDWSTRTMSFSEVRDLLAEVRNLSGGKHP